MEWFRRNPWFYSILGIMLTVTLVGMWYSSKDLERLSELKSQYENKNTQLQLFLKRSPAPTKANLEMLDQNFNQLMKEFASVQGALNLNTYNHELFFGDMPKSHNDAFFKIAKYVEDTRTLAATAGVKVPQDYRFGFSEYENIGPSGEAIERVHKQVKVMEALLLALFDSGISEFVSIKREASEPAKAGSAEGRGAVASDIFQYNAPRSARLLDSFDSLAFRLEFEGQSLALRNFLNQITNSSLPLAVSEIEVSLKGEAGSGDDRTVIRNNPFLKEEFTESSLNTVQVPIISENRSHFTVTLEFLELSDEALSSISGEGVKEGADA